MSQPRMAAVLGEEPFRGADRVRAEIVKLVVEHEAAVAAVLSGRLHAPTAVLSTSTLDLAAVALVPAALLRHHTVLPVLQDGSSLTLAATTAEPALVRPLEVATGRRVVVVVALEPVLTATLERALAAVAAGRTVLPGPKSTEAEPTLTLARPPDRSHADRVAKALGDLLDPSLPAQLKPGGPAVVARLTPGGFSRPSEASEGVQPIGAVRLKQVRAPSGPVPVAPTAASTSTERPWCLVVEDDDAIRGLISRVLRHDRCDVEEAPDGKLAVEALRRRRPDLVVLDAMLPHVHGFEICAAIKASPQWSTVPVLMVSAVFRGFDNTKNILEVHGADAFLEKPFEIHHLRNVAADLLKKEKPKPTTTPGQVLSSDRARALVDHHLTLGDVTAAAAVIDSWLAGDPFSARAWLERGNLALANGDYVAALRAYEFASVYDGSLFLAHVSLATLFGQLGFARRARATWEKAVAAAPDPGTAALLRAQLADAD